MKLLVRNLDRGTTEIEMRKLFEEYGGSSNALSVRSETGASKGFGFVYMPDLDSSKNRYVCFEW